MAHSLRRRTEPVDYTAAANASATPGWLKKPKSRVEDGASSPELKSLATTSKPKAGPSKSTNAAKHATQNKENEEAAGKRNSHAQHTKQALLALRSTNAAGAAKAEGDRASPTKRGRAGQTKSAAEPASQPEPAAGKASRKSMPASKAASDAAVLARAAVLKRKSAPAAVEPAAAQGATAGKANSKKGKAVSAQQAEQVDAEGDVVMTQAAKPAPKPAANKGGANANSRQARSAAAKAASAPQEPARSGGSTKTKGAAASAPPAGAADADAPATAPAPAKKQPNSSGNKGKGAAAAQAALESSGDAPDAAAGRAEPGAAGAAASKKRKSSAAAATAEAAAEAEATGAAAAAADADAPAGGANGSKGGANKRRRGNNATAGAGTDKHAPEAEAAAPAATHGRQSKAQASKAPSAAAAAAAGSVGTQGGKGKPVEPESEQQQQEEGQEEGLPPTPHAMNLAQGGSADFAALQANYRQLAASYETLKARKIKTLQAMIDEENKIVKQQGEMANDLATHWRKEAETQRQFAAAAKAPSTNAQMKALQDKNLDLQSRLVAIEALITEKDAALTEAQRQLEAAGFKPPAVDASMQACPEVGEMSAQQTPGLMGPPASANRRAVSMQFPTPKPPSPGIGLQFPTPPAPAGPFNTPGGINASLWGGPVSAAKPPMHGATSAAAGVGAAGPVNTPGGINASLWGGVMASAGRASVPHTMRGMEAARAVRDALGQGGGAAAGAQVAAVQAGVQTSHSGSPVQGLLDEDGAAKAAASAGYDGQFAFPSDDPPNANQAANPSPPGRVAHSGESVTSLHPSAAKSAQRAVQLQQLAQDMRLQQQRQQQQGPAIATAGSAQRTPAGVLSRLGPGQVLGRGCGGTPVLFAMPPGSGFTPGVRSINLPNGMKAPANTPMHFVAAVPYAGASPVQPGGAAAVAPHSATRSGISPTAGRLRNGRLSFDKAGLPMISPTLSPQAAGEAGAAGAATAETVAGSALPVTAGTAAAAGPEPAGAAQGANAPGHVLGGAAGAAAGTPQAALLRAAAAVPLPGDTPISGMRTPGMVGAALEGVARMTPRLSAARPPASITRHLMPLEYLLDFEAALVGPRSYKYTHATTGFAFKMGPAASMGATSALHGVEDDSAADDEEGDVYEEVAFVPVALGSAAAVVPEYLKEPITFAASRKPQLVRILVEALADAAKVARANRRAAHNNAGPSAPGAMADGVAAMEGVEEGA